MIGMEYRGAFGIAKDKQVFRFRKCHYHDIVEVEWEKWLILPTSESLDHVGAIIIARKKKLKISIFCRMEKANWVQHYNIVTN